MREVTPFLDRADWSPRTALLVQSLLGGVIVLVLALAAVALVVHAPASGNGGGAPPPASGQPQQQTGPPVTPPPSGSPRRPGATVVDVFTLPAGACYVEVDADEGRVREQQCSRAHDGEIYHKFPLVPATGGGAPFPGEPVIERAADEACGKQFESFVGVPFERSSLTYLYWYPDEVDWQHGIREVVCVVVSGREGVKVAFSARGSRR